MSIWVKDADTEKDEKKVNERETEKVSLVKATVCHITFKNFNHFILMGSQWCITGTDFPWLFDPNYNR